MKAKNLNNSSKKTRKTIKKVFAQMLAEKKELSLATLSKITKITNNFVILTILFLLQKN